MTKDERVQPIICAEQLTRAFEQNVVLRALDLRIERGELFGLVGPDGAGKTTALRLMGAVMRPTAGRVSVAGFDSVRQAESLRAHLGYMPQRAQTLAGMCSTKTDMLPIWKTSLTNSSRALAEPHT